jgi:diguanylate cyclase (GGDEF)-like protein
MHLSMITLILLIINVFYPLYFSINRTTNNFSSGPFKWVHYLVLASLYLYMLYFVLKNRRKTDPFVVRIFILFFALPIIGMLVQLIDSKLHFSWTSIVLAILIVYVFLESTSTEYDFLTKLFNRQSYENYVRHLIERKKPFGIMLIDLNDFKTINDTHGHQKGDQVLIMFSKVLKRVFPVDAMVCRMGGDEFMVVIEVAKSTIDWELSEIDRILKKHDDDFMHTIRFSYGYQTYSEDLDFEELYTTVDQKMYINKKAHKKNIYENVRD